MVRCPFAAGHEDRSMFDRVAHMPLRLRGGRLVVHGAHRRGVVERVPQVDLPFDRRREQTEIGIANILVHEDPLAGGA